ncbi:MAG TPA: DinB family protein, partial [Thermoanaerobaculia bacterium]|nr:DinB family protein [Thermoanaerobaculia bacterium]
VAALPDACFGWRPAPGAFSCGELVVHLIQAERFWRRLFVEAAAGRPFDPFSLQGSGEERLVAFRSGNLESAARPGLATFGACLAWWDEIEAETLAAFAAFSDEQLESVVVDHPITGMHRPLIEMLHFMISHEVHHRGQLSAYAKMLGVPQPPLYAE